MVASSLQQGRPHRLGDAQPCPIENVSIRLDEVEPAVAVKVLNRDAEAEHRPRGRRDPQRGRVVAVECLTSSFDPSKCDRRSAQEVCDRQVRSPIAVEVAQGDAHPRRVHARRVTGDAGLLANLLESELAAIGQQPAGSAVVGHVNVGNAIARQVGDQDPQAAPLRLLAPAWPGMLVKVPSPLLR